VKIEVYFTPHGLAPNELAGRTVVAVDLLRASTTIAVALAAGAREILPAGSTEEALRLAQNLESDQVVLAGERKSVRIPGFALGNSPLEFTPEAVGGRTIVLTTTNGTQALLAAQGAREIIVAAAVNFGVVVERARAAAKAQLQAAKALPAAYLREVFEGDHTRKWRSRRLGELIDRCNYIIHPGDRAEGEVSVGKLREGFRAGVARAG